MAQNAVLTARLALDTTGNYVILPCQGITKAVVQVLRGGTGANITTTFSVEPSNDGAFFVPFATPKTISLNAPTGSHLISPMQVGATDPFDNHSQYLKVQVASNAASGDFAIVKLLDVDTVTPGGSIVEAMNLGFASTSLVVNGQIIEPPSGQTGGGIPTS